MVQKIMGSIEESDFNRLSPSKADCIHGTIGIPNPEDGGATEIMGKFKIYDGFAVGECLVDGVTREVFAQYPITNLVNKLPAAKYLKDTIHENLKIKEERDVTILEIFISYAQFKFADSL